MSNSIHGRHAIRRRSGQSSSVMNALENAHKRGVVVRRSKQLNKKNSSLHRKHVNYVGNSIARKSICYLRFMKRNLGAKSTKTSKRRRLASRHPVRMLVPVSLCVRTLADAPLKRIETCASGCSCSPALYSGRAKMRAPFPSLDTTRYSLSLRLA